MEKLRSFLSHFDHNDIRDRLKTRMQELEQFELETLIIVTFFFLIICACIYFAFNIRDFI